MLKPKIIYSDKILNTLSIFMKIGGISLFPFVILREYLLENNYYYIKRKVVINHESIHFQQALEMLVIPFYMWYALEWLFKALSFKLGSKTPYERLSFEREAYLHEHDLNYLQTRKRYAWLKYIWYND